MSLDHSTNPLTVALRDATAERRGKNPTKLSVKRRLELLLDAGSFQDDGLLANAETPNHPSDGVRTGVGTINGRFVAVIAHDFTVKAGSWGTLNVEKQIRILERADRESLPVFYFVDSAGGRLNEMTGFFPGRRGAGRIFHLQVRLSGRVPQICVLFGPAAAGGAYMPAFCDWVGMIDQNASMSLASSRVVKTVTGEDVTLEQMGGATMHTTVSGSGDQKFSDEESAISAARELFEYLPNTYLDAPPVLAPAPVAEGTWTGIIPDSPKRGYDIRRVIERIVDADSFFEIKAAWAQEMVVGFGRLDGRTVGFVANQPRSKGGAIFVDSADKAARFITWCDAFNIPLVFLLDVPGFMIGLAVEEDGIIRHGAKLISAMSAATVPRMTVVVRKAYAAGYYAMCAAGFEPDAVLALPTAEIAAMSAEAAVNAMHAPKIAELHDSAERNEFVAERVAEYQHDIDLLRMASGLFVDAVIDPDDLRATLVTRIASASRGEPRRVGRHHPVAPV